MYCVTYDLNPDDPEFANAPESRDIFDTKAEADFAMAQIRECGGRVTGDWEMSGNECYNHNVSIHCPDGY